MSEYTTREILDMIEANQGPKGLDLSGKDLSGIDLGRAVVGAQLDKTREDNPEAEPSWWCAAVRSINLEGANLQGANLGGANLEGADLGSVNLQGSFLGGANLEEAFLESAKLEGAYVGSANLQRAMLWNANLVRLDLRDTKSVRGVFLYRALLGRTQLTKEQLGGAITEESRGLWLEAKETYLALKNNFEQIGRYDDASWAYRKERRMEKREAWQKAKEAFREYNWGKAIGNAVKVGSDHLVELVCDYGEGIWRVIGTLLLLWVVFAISYGVIAGVWGPWQKTAVGEIRHITRNPVDLLVFSIGVTSRMPGGLEARTIQAMRVLMAVEALLGTLLVGLLGFVLGNRIRRS